MPSKKDLYKQAYNQNDWPGLNAITCKTKEIYGDQEPSHLVTDPTPYEFGGKDPLWGFDCYTNNNQQQHIHYISLGFTNLYYDEGAAEDEENGFGFEITFRYRLLKEESGIPGWPIYFLQNIARYVFESEKGFDDYHYMSANGPIRTETTTEVTAFAFYTDKEMGIIETPHGTVKFLQLYGLTTKEYNSIQNKEYTVRQLLSEHMINNPLLITDLNRK